MPMTYKSLIRHHREARELTIDDMAKRMRMSVEMYDKLENGQRLLTVQVLEKVANALEVPLQELIPSLAGKYSIETHNNSDNAGAVTVHEASLEGERKLWQELDKARLEILAAKNEVIAAQNAALEALKVALSGR